MSKEFKITIGIIGVFILLGFLFVGVLFLSSFGKGIQNSEDTKAGQLYDCNNAARLDYDLEWNNQCDGLGLDKQCRLPVSISDGVNDSYQSALDRCVALYK